MSATLVTPTVLTAAEAAEFLRLPVAEVIAAADAGHLPGRRVGAEWRFLREGLADWLRGPVAAPRVWGEALQRECDRELAELAATRKPRRPDAAPEAADEAELRLSAEFLERLRGGASGPGVSPTVAQWVAANPRVWDEAAQKEAERELAETAALRRSWGLAAPGHAPAGEDGP